MRLAGSLGLVAAASLVALQVILASAIHGGDAEVTRGSDDGVFSRPPLDASTRPAIQ